MGMTLMTIVLSSSILPRCVRKRQGYWCSTSGPYYFLLWLSTPKPAWRLGCGRCAPDRRAGV